MKNGSKGSLKSWEGPLNALALLFLLPAMIIYCRPVEGVESENSSVHYSSNSAVQAGSSEQMSKAELVRSFDGMKEETPIQLFLVNRTEIQAIFVRYDDVNERVWFRLNEDKKSFPGRSVALTSIRNASVPSPRTASPWSLTHPKRGRSTIWLKWFLDTVGMSAKK